MEFGSTTNVIKERITPEYVDRYRAVGVTCLEIGAKVEFVGPDDAEQHALLREHFEKTGARAHSIHAQHKGGFTIANEDAAIRDAAIAQARMAARIIVALGGDVVVVHPGGVTREVADMDAYLARVREHAPRIVEAVSSEGARVAFENALPEHYPDRPDALMDLVEMFPLEQAGVCIDTGHANCTPWTTAAIRRAAGRILTTHVQDNDGTRDMHIMPGHGTTDWDTFMQAFYDAGYGGPWVFECGGIGPLFFDHAAGSMQLLREAWERAEHAAPAV